MKRTVILCLQLLGVLLSSAQVCSSQRYIDTVFHAVHDTTGVYFATATPFGALAQPQDLYMDIFEPAGDTLAKRPLIVFQFGGGFTIGWRTEPAIPQFCDYFAKCGYVVATIDYRIGLNPLDTNSTVRAFYRGVQDERAALRFLSANANYFGIDTAHIFLTGTSAGCFCALANAFMTDADRPASTYGSPLEPGDMGCMDCSGNNLFGLRIPRIKGIVNQWGAMLDTAYIDNGEEVPVISFHGDQDILVPYVYGYPFQLPVFPAVYGSVPVHQRLTNAGVPNILHTLAGYGHEPELLAPWLNDTIYNYTRPFLYNLLKPATPVINAAGNVCQGDILQYNVAPHSGSKYCWQVSNAQLLMDNGPGITVLANDTGIITVTVSELGYIEAGSDAAAFTTQVVPRPTANFGYISNQLQVTLSNWSSQSDNYSWSFGDGTFASDSNPVKNYTAGGTYVIELVAANSFCADTFTTSLTVDSCPRAGFTYQVDNFNGFFHADTTNTLTYQWNFGDGDSVSVPAANVFHQYAVNGAYLVTLKVQNALGCVAVDTAEILVDATVNNITAVTPLDIIHCSGDNCLLKNPWGQPCMVQVFDMAGKRLQQFNLYGTYGLNMGAFSAGVYFIKVTLGTSSTVKRIIRE